MPTVQIGKWLMRFSFLVLLLLAHAVSAAPIEFREISFWLRVGESEQPIVQQIASRRLLKPLTEQEIEILKSQHASDRVLKILSDARYVISADERQEIEARKAIQKQAIIVAAPTPPPSPSAPEIITIKYGEPFELNRWSGLSSGEIRFFPKGLGAVIARGKPAFVNPTAVAGGMGKAVSLNDRDEILRNYSPAQISDIDTTSGVVVNGRILYPIIHGSGGTLYFVSRNIDGVQVVFQERR